MQGALVCVAGDELVRTWSADPRGELKRPGNYKIIKRKLRNVRIRWELEDNEDGVNLPSSKGDCARRGVGGGGARSWRGAESRRSRTRRLNVCIVGNSSLAHDYLYDPYIFPISTVSPEDKFDSFWTFDIPNSGALSLAQFGSSNYVRTSEKCDSNFYHPWELVSYMSHTRFCNLRVP